MLEIAKVTERPDFKQVFPEGTWSISLVELSAIIAFQPNVDVGYAANQGGETLSSSDQLSAVRLCFPHGKPTTLAVNLDQAQKAITVSGINPSLQVVGYNWGQQDPQGPFVVSFYIHSGPNELPRKLSAAPRTPCFWSAAALETRVLVTLDLDFANVQAHPPGTNAGIIVFRSKAQDKLTLISLLKRAVPVLKRRSPEGQLWIVQADRVRIRE